MIFNYHKIIVMIIFLLSVYNESSKYLFDFEKVNNEMKNKKTAIFLFKNILLV